MRTKIIAGLGIIAALSAVALTSAPAAQAGAVCTKTGICGEAYNAYYNPIWVGPIFGVPPYSCTIKLPPYTNSKTRITDNDLVCVGTRMAARLIQFGVGQDHFVRGPVAFKMIDTDKYNVYMEPAKRGLPNLNALDPTLKKSGTVIIDGKVAPVYEVRR